MRRTCRRAHSCSRRPEEGSPSALSCLRISATGKLSEPSGLTSSSPCTDRQFH